MTFENAFVTNSVCCPSRVTALTGRYSSNHGVINNLGGDGAGGYPAYEARGLGKHNVAVWLRLANYKTALFGKFINGYDSKQAPGGFSFYRKTTSTAEDPSIGKYAAQFIEKNSKQPMFLALWFRRAHVPLEYDKRFRTKHRDHSLPKPPSFNEVDVSDKSAWVRSLPRLTTKKQKGLAAKEKKRLRTLEGVGLALSRVEKALQQKNQLDETYFVFMSDNGYMLGEHRIVKPEKAIPYEESIHVPLVIRGPGVPKGIRRTELVSNNDLVPTFVDWARAEATKPMDGRSLAPLLSNAQAPKNWRTALMTENPGSRARVGHDALRTESHSYIEWETGESELYELGDDRYQLHNIYDEADPELRADLEKKLEAIKDCSGRESCIRAER